MIDFISKIFNINRYEWPRVLIALVLKVLLHTVYIMGWTLIVSIFVVQVGVHELPILYIVNASLIILGSFIYSLVVHRFSKVKLMLVTSVLSILVFALSRFFLGSNIIFFVVIFLVAEAALLSQLNILMILFIEEIFSPLEAQRTAPFIESAEPIGTIIGGLMIALFAYYLSVPFLVVMLIPVLLIFTIVLFVYKYKFDFIPHLKNKEEIEEISKFEKLGRMSLLHFKAIPFIKTLSIIVLIQWVFFNFVEFQYTKYVHDAISHDGVHQENHGDDYEEPNTVYLELENTDNNKKMIGATQSDIERLQQIELTKGLGFLHILFGLLVLFSRIFIHSRVFERIGLVKSSIIYPISSLIGVISMLINPSFYIAVFLKADTEISGAIHNDAYHNSYYGLKEVISSQVKELLEGVIKPLGLIVGTIIIFVLERFCDGELLIDTLNYFSVCILIFMIYVLYFRHRTNYTNVSRRNLDLPGDHPIKFIALEVLSQKGHINASEIMVKNLIYKSESIHLRKKILQVLGNIADVSTIPEIVKCFDDEDIIKLEALKSISNFSSLSKDLKNRSFTRYRLVQSLKDLFLRSKSKKIKSEIIKVFKNINDERLITFLLKVIKDSDDDLKADCIYVCGLFKDIGIEYFINGYLDSSNTKIKSNTIISLWNFKRYRLKLIIHLITLIESKNKDDLLSGIYVLGETKSIQEIPRLLGLMESKDIDISLYAAIALAKMNHNRSVDKVISMILHHNKTVSGLAKELSQNIHPEIKDKINKRLHKEVSSRIHAILKKVNALMMEELSVNDLEDLRDAYKLIDNEKEIIKINNVINKKMFKKDER